jgi:hypothetical protein
MRRLVTIIAVFCGIAGACAEFKLTNFKPEPKSLEETAFIFDLCIAFYGVTYAVGMLLYTLLGRWTERETVTQLKVNHLLALNAFGLALAVFITIRVPRLLVLRPAMVFAVVMFAWSVRNFLRRWQIRRSARGVLSGRRSL